MSSRRSSKALKLLSTIGLAIVLGAILPLLYLFANNKANPINQLVIALSPWRKLRPYLIAQARLESADFTSNIYRQTNNPLAMGHASRRPQLGPRDKNPSNIFEKGGDLPIQIYRNDTQGFRDMFLWYKFTKFPREVINSTEYVSELKARGYFTTDEYSYREGLNFWLNAK